MYEYYIALRNIEKDAVDFYTEGVKNIVPTFGDQRKLAKAS